MKGSTPPIDSRIFSDFHERNLFAFEAFEIVMGAGDSLTYPIFGNFNSTVAVPSSVPPVPSHAAAKEKIRY